MPRQQIANHKSNETNNKQRSRTQNTKRQTAYKQHIPHNTNKQQQKAKNNNQQAKNYNKDQATANTQQTTKKTLNK